MNRTFPQPSRKWVGQTLVVDYLLNTWIFRNPRFSCRRHSQNSSNLTSTTRRFLRCKPWIQKYCVRCCISVPNRGLPSALCSTIWSPLLWIKSSSSMAQCNAITLDIMYFSRNRLLNFCYILSCYSA